VQEEKLHDANANEAPMSTDMTLACALTPCRMLQRCEVAYVIRYARNFITTLLF
jgi:hypothetical protein